MSEKSVEIHVNESRSEEKCPILIRNYPSYSDGLIVEDLDEYVETGKQEGVREKKITYFFLIISSIIFFSVTAYFLIKILTYHQILGNLQTSLIRAIPFKIISHPEPPNSLWGSVVKPYPTGSFWTNLVVRTGDGAIGLHPYGIKTLDIGIQISYGAYRRVVSKQSIVDPFLCDLQISVAQQYMSRSIEAYDNISATMTYKTIGNGRYKAHLVKSSPFVTVVFDGTTPIISSPIVKISSVDARAVKDSVGTHYIVSMGNNQKWLVYCSEPVAFTWKDNILQSPLPIKGVVRVAILPNQNYEAAFTALIPYVQKYPTGAAVSLSYPSGTVGIVTYQYTTVGVGSLLMLALPHHVPLLQQPQVDNDENKKLQQAYTPVWGLKGKVKPVVGDVWKLQYNLVQVGWHYALNEKLVTSQLDEIAKYLIQDVKSVFPSSTDPYGFGKEIGRMARLALIADNLGIADARQQAISNLEVSLIPWLQSTNSNPLLYDKIYGGILTNNGVNDQFADFGSGWYSDHHFHYGYFLHAAAVLARFDSPFFEANKPAFESLVRDICNPDNSDTDFPIARHKDFFDGHSWASGLFQQANGKGQESSSESTNAYYGAYLYGLATANLDLVHFAHMLLTMEVQATQTYWHMSNDNIFDSPFSSSRMVGNMGALDVTASTWFGSELEFVHGINLMPLSPITSVLFDSTYVQLQYPVLGGRLPPPTLPSLALCSANPICKNLGMTGSCCPTTDGNLLACCDSQGKMQDEWKSLILIDLAVVDRDAAWNQILTLNGFGNGNSRSNSLFWAASRTPPVLNFNSSRRSTDLLVKSSCSSNSACDAVGIVGECCPTATGIMLGCCPKV